MIDLQTGQKTGLYLDQLDNYAAVARFARGRRVLDCFCNQGGFALACALAGASEVTAVDVSQDAMDAVARNARLNGVSVQCVTDNAFDFLKKEAALCPGRRRTQMGFNYPGSALFYQKQKIRA